MLTTWRPSGIVTFTSDYGVRDSYVAQVKGVILERAPTSTIIDVTHEVAAQDILEGAFQLATAWRAFPVGTIHLAVVDPGVGSERRAVSLLADGHAFVLPDNGLATFVLAEAHQVAAWSLDRSEWFRQPVAPTFHGRDIFGPICGLLASGMSLAEDGTPLDPASLVKLPIQPVIASGGSIVGPIVSIDRFGNCRTLIRREQLPDESETLCIRCGQLELLGIVRTFTDVAPDMPLAYFGSHGGLEIAVRDGNAAATWHLERGMLVEVRRAVT